MTAFSPRRGRPLGSAEALSFLADGGLRYPEIGAALGISASAVGEFLRRAVARLRKVRDE